MRFAPSLRWCAALLALTCAAGCSSSEPNRDPSGEVFPSVVGESLDGDEVSIPEDYAGRTPILLIGYEQDAQFDIDRWILGLLQLEVDAPLLELPTIPSMPASVVSGWIDDGMRSGIPAEDWSSVVTLYGGSADPVAEFTGNESGNRARVVVLDAQGQVAWFEDDGYSATHAMDVARVVKELAAASAD